MYLTAAATAQRLGLLANITSPKAIRVRLAQMRRHLVDTGILRAERRGRTTLYHEASVDALLKRLRAAEVMMDKSGRITYMRRAA